MEDYGTVSIAEALKGNPYPGRGILVGQSGRKAVSAYFIMGRSENSRNRVFSLQDGALFTKPFDETKVKDPSLIIYPALRTFENRLIVTNGDQTDTVFQGFLKGQSFEDALRTRTFEPDAPNYTPRISGLISFRREVRFFRAPDEEALSCQEADLKAWALGVFSYELGIIKSRDREGTAALHAFYGYEPLEGAGHLIHTYVTDGNPLPPYEGEPKAVRLGGSIDECTEELWNALDPYNRISLYVRYTDPVTGAYTDRIRNKNQNQEATS